AAQESQALARVRDLPGGNARSPGRRPRPARRVTRRVYRRGVMDDERNYVVELDSGYFFTWRGKSYAAETPKALGRMITRLASTPAERSEASETTPIAPLIAPWPQTDYSTPLFADWMPERIMNPSPDRSATEPDDFGLKNPAP